MTYSYYQSNTRCKYNRRQSDKERRRGMIRGMLGVLGFMLLLGVLEFVARLAW